MKSNLNKVALVTGGSRGLGKAMALELAEKNFDIILTYHSNESMANEVVEEIQTKGRGTRGREWVSQKGNLFSSIIGSF